MLVLVAIGIHVVSAALMLPRFRTVDPRWLRPPRSPSRFGSTPPEPNPRTAPVSPDGGRSLCAGGLGLARILVFGQAVLVPTQAPLVFGQTEDVGQAGDIQNA